VKQEVEETVEEPLALDGLCHDATSFLVFNAHQLFLMIQELFSVK
jgi:hypothetical protein